MSNSDRIDKALNIATRYGCSDENHHSLWTIDQIVRALTDCPMVEGNAKDIHGTEYSFCYQGESDEYLKFITDTKDGVDGPETYTWEIGIAP